MVTDAVGDLPSVDPLLQRLLHGVLDRLEERETASSRARPPAGTRTPVPIGAGSTRSPTVARNGLASLLDHLDRRAGADRPLDADRRRLAEGRRRCRSRRQRRLDDLLLHLAVERDGELLADVVLPQVDQRVLLGELGERDVQRALVSRLGAERRPSPASAARSGAARADVARAPIASPIWMSPSPQSLPICPAATDGCAGRPRRGRRR